MEQAPDTQRSDGASAPCTPDTADGRTGPDVGVIPAGSQGRAPAGTVPVPPVGTIAGADTAPPEVPEGRDGRDGPANPIDAAQEQAYWSEHFHTRDYVGQGASFDDYGPAYGLGVDACSRHPGRPFDDLEAQLSTQWATSHGASSLSWPQARPAARDAWAHARPSR